MSSSVTVYAPVALSVISTLNNAVPSRSPPVTVAVSTPPATVYVTVSWPSVAVPPLSAAANVKPPVVPTPSGPALPTSVLLNTASLVFVSPARFASRSPTVLAALPPVRPSSSTAAADVLPSVGVFTSTIWKLKSATAVSPSPSVTVNVPVTGATGLTVTASALNSYEPSAFARSSPLPRSTHCDQPSAANVSAVAPMCVTLAASAPATKSKLPPTVAPSFTFWLDSAVALGASSSNVMVSVLFVVLVPSASVIT